MAIKRFHIQLTIECDLSVDDMWPDGDAPTNPTAVDVRDLIRRCGDIDIIQDWGLTDELHVWVSEL